MPLGELSLDDPFRLLDFESAQRLNIIADVRRWNIGYINVLCNHKYIVPPTCIYLLSSDFMLSTNYMMITSSNDNLLALKSLYNTITNKYACL